MIISWPRLLQAPAAFAGKHGGYLSIFKSLSPRGVRAVRHFSPSSRLAEQTDQAAAPLALRPYQQECIDKVLEGFASGRRAAVSLPTGSGKTVVFCHLMDKVKALPGQGSRVLIVVNRRELVFQTVRTIQSIHPEFKVEVEIGNRKYSPDTNADVCVASVATISRPDRLARFDPKHFKLVILDEAHHSAAQSYVDILRHFGLDDPNCSIYLAGFSATFFRHDGKGLDHAFDEVLYHRPLLDMMDDGHLTKAKITNCKAFGKLTAKDRGAGAGHILRSIDGLGLVLKTYLDTHPQYHSTVIFAMDRAHVESLVSLFRENGIDARSVDGTMSLSDRDKVISEFKERKFPVIVNCAVLTEGTDIPCIDQVILARPLGSVGMALQMVGRGLRQYPGKEHCHIVQFPEFSNYGSHGTLTPMLKAMVDVEETDVVDQMQEQTPSLRADFDRWPSKPPEIQEVDLSTIDFSPESLFTAESNYRPTSPENSAFDWVYFKNLWFLFGPYRQGTGETHLRIRKYKGQYQVLDGRAVTTFIKHSRQKVIKLSMRYETSNLADALRTAEQMASQLWGWKSYTYLQKWAPWRRAPASEKQLMTLRSDRIFREVAQGSGCSRGAASNLLNLKAMKFQLTPEFIRTCINK